MFNTYYLSDFGNELRIIRKKCGFSQTDIKVLIGINEDTMRRIENGYVIPKYETLELLSSLYKRDLLEVLQVFRIDKYYYNYFATIDKILTNNEIHLLDNLILDFEENLNNNSHAQHLINKFELTQFALFLTGVRQYNSKESSDHKNAEVTVINALLISIPNFQLVKFSSYNYNFFEIRLLFLLGLIREKLKDINISIDLLDFVLNYLIIDGESTLELQKIILKSYSNISYNYHRIDNHNLALKYANAGIDYAVKNYNMSSLYFLYARKGAAEYFIGYDNYLDSFTKCLHILEINKQYDLATLYRKILLDTYSIIL